jgi:hypothetical protein
MLGYLFLQTMVITASAGVLFVTAGALMIEVWSNAIVWSNLTMGAGVLSIILGAIYLGDTGYTFKFA